MMARLVQAGLIGGLAVIAGLWWGGLGGDVSALAVEQPAAACDTVSCTAYLPLIVRSYPAPPDLEVTQGIQQPDNSVTLIENRATWVRYTLTSTVAHSNVSAYLHGVRNGVPLPGSPIAAVNNPRTLKATADRSTLADTFNFQLPASWLNGTLALSAQASNGTTFTLTTGAAQFAFVHADPLNVVVVPINYTCTGGGSVLPGGAPYAYVTDYTYRTYPVPSVNRSVHAAINYTGPCTSGQPNPTGADWSDLLDAVTTVYWAEGQPASYYYGLLHVYCSGGCIAGIGWIGLRAAVGFDGIGSSHSQAGETHAHETGHNHGRWHAPGCGASDPDPGFPYLNGSGQGIIGDASNPNYGFDITTQAIFPYSSYRDFMSYCNPQWISDYTYSALFNWSQTQSLAGPLAAPGERSLLVAGTLDADGDGAALEPAFALPVAPRIPEPGEYTLEMIDGAGRVAAAYPFAPMSAHADRTPPGGGQSHPHFGFRMALPYVEGLASIRIVHGGRVIGALAPGPTAPSVSGGITSAVEGAGVRVTWSASDVDGDRLVYLARASTDGGQTWQVIGVNLPAPDVVLLGEDFAGKSVLLEILASDGLHTRSVRYGPVDVHP